MLGAQRPRVSSVPTYAYSDGLDAIELVESAGRHLDDWQSWVLTHMLGARTDGQWAAAEVGLSVPRQNGKGDIIMARELAGLYVLEEELIIHSAHLYPTAKEAFRRILGVIEDCADLKRKVKRVSHTNGDEGIELVNGSRLKFVARSKGGGRGLFGDTIILDEAFALVDDHIEALLPVMSSRPNPQVLYVSSPALDAETGAVWMGIRKRGEAAANGLFWADWGCEPGSNLDDISNWRASNPALGIRISLESVARERQAMSPDGFGRERLGIWPETAGDAMISPELWQKLATSTKIRPDQPVFAVDVAPDRQTAAIVAVGLLEDGRHLLSIVDSRPGTSWIPERVADLHERRRPLCWVLDAKSPAATLIPALAEHGIVEADREEPRRGQLIVMNAYDTAIAWGLFVDRARQLGMAHLDEPPLNVALAGAKVRTLGDGSAWARRSGTDITPLVAATQASWAYETLAAVLLTEYDPLAFVL